MFFNVCYIISMSNYLDIAILLYLLDGKPKSAPFLASKFEVCQKTIYRHVNNLVYAGLPITTFTGKNGGIILNTNNMYNLNNLTHNEIEFLKGLINKHKHNNTALATIIYSKLDSYILTSCNNK